MDSSRRALWPTWMLLAGSVAILGMSLAGYAMLASYSSTTPEHVAEWQRVAWVYLGLAGLATFSAASAVLSLVRSRRLRPDADDRAG